MKDASNASDLRLKAMGKKWKWSLTNIMVFGKNKFDGIDCGYVESHEENLNYVKFYYGLIYDDSGKIY